MTATDPSTRLQALREAAERVSVNLVDLEIDSGRRLLDATALQGETATRWERASERMSELWRRHGLLEDLLSRAEALRGRRHTLELGALLDKRSIEVTSADVPLAERRLLGGTQSVERCSPDELLAEMSAAFDEVKATLAEIAAAWDVLIPELDSARGLLADAKRLAAPLGEGDGAELARCAEKLEALAATVTGDPLAVPSRGIVALRTELESLRDELDAATELKRGFERRLLGARERLSRLQAAIEDSRETSADLLAKIAGATPTPAPTAADEPRAALAQITDLAGRGAWRDASRSLERWTGQVDSLTVDAEAASAANRAPIQARNQLRSLLDAYRAKAGRLGRLEDPHVASTYERAQRALYEAPTDLPGAAQLVRRYQEALRPSGERSS